MTAKFLQGLGLLALLGLVVGSIAALALVKERVHVTFADEDEARRGPDPLELLRADVGALKDDLHALNEGIGQNLEALHGALEEDAAARAQTLATELGELRTRIAGLEARLEHAQLGAAPAPSSAPSVAAVPDEPQPAAQAPASAAPPAPQPAAPKKSFLSFKLPSDSFAFDKPMRFEIVPSLSRVGFDAKSSLHDFSGTTSKVEGELTTCLARPAEDCRGDIRVAAASLDTGDAARDEELQKTLGTADWPTLRFECTGFTLDSPDAVDAAAERLSGKVRGRLTMHGTTHELEMPVRVSVDAAKRVAIEGEVALAMSAYGIEPPSKLGLIKVEDQIKLWIALRARSLGLVSLGTVSLGTPGDR